MKISNWNPLGRPVNTSLWPAGAVTTGPGPGGDGTPPALPPGTSLAGVVISGTPTAGQEIVATSGTAASWQTVDGALTVKDEGTPLATAATSLDFVGAGVIASGASAAKTITIPGGATASDTGIWRPLMDGAGNVVTDGATGEAVMAFST